LAPVEIVLPPGLLNPPRTMIQDELLPLVGGNSKRRSAWSMHCSVHWALRLPVKHDEQPAVRRRNVCYYETSAAERRNCKGRRESACHMTTPADGRRSARTALSGRVLNSASENSGEQAKTAAACVGGD